MKRRHAEEQKAHHDQKVDWERLIGLELPKGYRLLKVLGTGPIGAVFEAVQKRAELSHLVAIKIIAASDSASAAELAAKLAPTKGLQHAHVVNVMDVGRLQSYVYLVMERLNGQTLRQLIDRDGSLEPRRCVSIGIQVLGALEAAHDRGVVHGDVKPSNLMLTRRGDQAETVKVMDFSLPPTLGGAASRTPTGPVSPTQLCSQPPTPASDVFALAAALYRAISGRSPYRSRSAPDLAQEIQKGPPPMVSPRGARVPAELDSVIRQALRAKSTDRISAPEFRQRLVECASILDGATQSGASGKRQTGPLDSLPSGLFGPPKVTWAVPSGATQRASSARGTGTPPAVPHRAARTSSARLGASSRTGAPTHTRVGTGPHVLARRPRSASLTIVVAFLGLFAVATGFYLGAIGEDPTPRATFGGETAVALPVPAAVEETPNLQVVAEAPATRPLETADTPAPTPDPAASEQANAVETAVSDERSRARPTTRRARRRRARRRRTSTVSALAAPAAPKPAPVTPRAEAPAEEPAAQAAATARLPVAGPPAQLSDIESNPYLR